MIPTAPTVDPPGALELLALVEAFLSADLMPALQDERLRYRTRVAANLLRIAARETIALATLSVDSDGRAMPPSLLADAGSVRSLTRELAEGHRSITDPATFALLRGYVDAKLRIAAPNVLGADGVTP